MTTLHVNTYKITFNKDSQTFKCAKFGTLNKVFKNIDLAIEYCSK